jgi:N-acyl-D-aspartate/D-glutamate deacylase
MSEEFDIVIRGAHVVDGTGSRTFVASVAVRDGFIVEVGEVRGDAGVVIDSEGLVVTPGFIDAHNHGDLSILYYPLAEGFVRQGITSFVGGTCGDTPGPYGDYIGEPWFLWDIYEDISNYMYYRDWLLPREVVNDRHRELYGWEIDWDTMGEFFERVEDKGLSPNFVPLVGHGDIRSLVMGPDYRREATGEEIEQMLEHVHVAMEDGCVGLSVGRDYEPGFYANFDELLACAGAAAEYGGLYDSHCLNRGPPRVLEPWASPPPKLDGVKEAIDIGREAGISVQISHLGSLYPSGPGDSEIMKKSAMEATLKVIDDAVEEGVDLDSDVIPNHLAGGIFTTPYLIRLLLPWMRISGSPEDFSKALRMDEFRGEIKETISSGKWFMLHPSMNPSWPSDIKVAESEEKEFMDKTVKEIAENLEVEPLEALLEIISRDPYTKAIRFREDDYEKRMLLSHPRAMVGVDTFATNTGLEHRNPPWMKPNPNSFGGFPRYFRRMVRETQTLPLEEAVRRVTSSPARKFKIKNRGTLKKGNHADIVLMDPETITDTGDQINPCQYPKGVEYVIINGEMVVEKGKHTGRKPGKILYRE